MKIDYKKLMSMKSDDALMDYLERPAWYTPSQIMAAALYELQQRDRVITGEDLQRWDTTIQKHKEREETEGDNLGHWNSTIKDKALPAYYSPFAILILSATGSFFVGVILFALNLKGLRRWLVPVLAFLGMDVISLLVVSSPI